MNFSANLGFLWSDLRLPDAIRQAKTHGFDAVECHWPYDFPAAEVKAALVESDLQMLGLNTHRGETGENGLSALPGREDAARAAVDQALEYAQAVGAKAVHVMAGFAQGPEAHKTFVSCLRYACKEAQRAKLTILIEPLNHYDAPGYFLQSTTQAADIIAEVNAPNLRLMFDCYHVQLSEGDLTHRLTELMPMIGHIQFAGVPARGRPDEGEVNYAHIFEHITSLGFTGPLGAEYKVGNKTCETLGWMEKYRTQED